MLPFFPFGMHFYNSLWLSTIFLIFSILNKHEQTSWFQTMEFIESTHAKSIRALEGGPDIHDILFNIVCLISSWFLIPLDDIHLWICFIFIVELPLFPMEVLMPANQVRSSSPIFENYMGTYAIGDYIHTWCDSWVFWYMLDLLG